MKNAIFRIPGLTLTAAVLNLAISANGEDEPRLSVSFLPDSDAVAVEWEPVSLVPAESVTSTALYPDYRIQSSRDLASWETLEGLFRGSVGVPPAHYRFEQPVETGTRYFRLLTGIHLSQANLGFLNLSGARFQGADFRGADLSGSNLSGADLRGADLRLADLRGADLSGAILSGARLENANLIGAQLDGAIIDEDALKEAITLSTLPVDPGFGLGDFDVAGAPSLGGANLGFSVGGAKDINNFRDNVANDFLPLFTDVTYEGLFYDYFFDTGIEEPCEELFCPSYSYAITDDPVSGAREIYLSVGLNSGIAEDDFERKKLNLTLVLDVSGSMNSTFNTYYYDRFGNRVEVEETENSDKQKMEIATEAVAGLLGHVDEDDHLAIVLFNGNASLLLDLTRVGDLDMESLEQRVLEVQAGGSTHMEAGITMATRLYGDLTERDAATTENRIIFLTDAMPNRGVTDREGLVGMARTNAENGLYTTFIGIGVDFNSDLIESISKTRGANYYSVHTAEQFAERMDEGFDFMVTPLVFDLAVTLSGPGYEIARVFGSPEANEASGELMKVRTLFPSRTENGETRGGLVLLELNRTGEPPSDEGLSLRVHYEDREGGLHESERTVVINADQNSGFFQNSGIRKGILLTRYANLLKDWIHDERIAYEEERWLIPVVTPEDGIILPPFEPQLGEWERQSVSLFVSRPYRELFGQFLDHFEQESEALGDETLVEMEGPVLEKLKQFGTLTAE